jgi:hypothetical protein
MITRRTTLILGAGASVPYVFYRALHLRDALLGGSGDFQALAAGAAKPEGYREADAASDAGD